MSMWLRMVLVVLSGELLAEASIGWAYVALVAPAPWFLALMAPGPDGEELTLGRAVLLSVLPYAIGGAHMWGLLGIGQLIYWLVVIYLPIAGVVMVLLAWPFVRPGSSEALPVWGRLGGLTAAWVVAHATRWMTELSFPTLVGAALIDAPPFNQLGALAGSWGLEAMIAGVSVLLAEAADRWLRRDPRVGAPLAVALGLVGVVALGGGVRLALAEPMITVWPTEGEPPPRPVRPHRTVAIPQASTPNWMHRQAWHLERFQEAIDANTMALVRDAIGRPMWGREPDWVVMPESTLGRALPAAEKKALADIRTTFAVSPWPASTTVFLVMTQRMERRNPERPRADRKDTVFVLEAGPDGSVQLRDRVSKRQLVPMGEWRYHPGDPWRPLKTQHGAVGAIICFESMYPTIANLLAAQGSEVLLVLTNDSGQRWSDAATWHARLGRLRAMETGQVMIHASQAGPSFIIDPYGRSSPSVGLFERGVLRAAVVTETVWTPHQAIGPYGGAALALLAWIGALGWTVGRRQPRNETDELPHEAQVG
ncbi:MAG: nitrilase-related carbon-nitrogen hydrolase [Myxococcota bacterium]